jgi:hypothetical protein
MIQTIKEIPVEIYDMTLTKSNDILISTFNSSDVKLITQSGQIKPILSVSPLITTGIHVTHNNDIILGVMEEYTYKLTDKSCRKIIVFGENKKEKQSYQYNKHKQRLFTLPYTITGDTERNGLICPDCVISLTSELLIIEIRISLLFVSVMSYI